MQLVGRAPMTAQLKLVCESAQLLIRQLPWPHATGATTDVDCLKDKKLAEKKVPCSWHHALRVHGTLELANAVNTHYTV